MEFLLLVLPQKCYPFFNFIEPEFSMFKFALIALLAALSAGLSGCYQIHSDDDLRTVPVTNNPNLLPNQGQRMTSAPM